jgi:hypothetical protein
MCISRYEIIEMLGTYIQYYVNLPYDTNLNDLGSLIKFVRVPWEHTASRRNEGLISKGLNKDYRDIMFPWLQIDKYSSKSSKR